MSENQQDQSHPDRATITHVDLMVRLAEMSGQLKALVTMTSNTQTQAENLNGRVSRVERQAYGALAIGGVAALLIPVGFAYILSSRHIPQVNEAEIGAINQRLVNLQRQIDRHYPPIRSQSPPLEREGS